MYFPLFMYTFDDFFKPKEKNEDKNVKESVIKLTKKLISPKSNTKVFTVG